ncbi:MAG: hypothetical protein LBH16_07480 [Treponema sp.]|jgi:hypothetical protein|nr:hypothetical protein [Treponema sp.]
MVFALVLVGLVIMAGTVYFALNKKSTFSIRIACLIAFAVMILTIIICLFIGFNNDSVIVDESVLIVGAPIEAEKDDSGGGITLLVMIIFMLGLFILIFFLTMREHKKYDARQ